MQAALNALDQIWNAPLLLYETAATAYENSEAAAIRQRKQELKPPRVWPRERRLSLDEVDTRNHHDKSFARRKHLPWKKHKDVVVADQSHSRLLSLPWEIREMIWAQIIREDDDGRINIVWSAYTNANDMHIGAHESKIRHHRSGAWMLNCLCSCRSVYMEMIERVYSMPTFIFDDYDLFIGWCALIIPRRHKQIQHLELKFNKRPSGMWNGINSPLVYTPIQHLRAHSPLPLFDPDAKENTECSTAHFISEGTAFRVIVELLHAMTSLRSLEFELDHEALTIMYHTKPSLELLSRVMYRETWGVVSEETSLTKENFLVGSDFWESNPAWRITPPEWPFTVVREYRNI